jgi:hypothetical protein
MIKEELVESEASTVVSTREGSNKSLANQEEEIDDDYLMN